DHRAALPDYRGLRDRGRRDRPAADRPLRQFPNRPPIVVDLLGSASRALRLDQIADLTRLTAEAERAAGPPMGGLRRLAAIWAGPSRFGGLAALAGHTVLAVGVGLLQPPTPTMVAASLVLGALVGLLRGAARNRETLEILLPVTCAFAVTVLVMLAVDLGYSGNPLLLVIAPLATFLGGGILRVAGAELAAGQVVAGAGRRVYGALVIVLPALGIVAAAAVVGALPPETFVRPPVDPFGPWATAPGCCLSVSGTTSISRRRAGRCSGPGWCWP